MKKYSILSWGYEEFLVLCKWLTCITAVSVFFYGSLSAASFCPHGKSMSSAHYCGICQKGGGSNSSAPLTKTDVQVQAINAITQTITNSITKRNNRSNSSICSDCGSEGECYPNCPVGGSNRVENYPKCLSCGMSWRYGITHTANCPMEKTRRDAEIARLEKKALQRKLDETERQRLEALRALEKQEREAFEMGGVLEPGALDGLSNLVPTGVGSNQIELNPNGIRIGPPDLPTPQMTDREFADYVAERLGIDKWGQNDGQTPYAYKNNAWPAGGPPVKASELQWVFETQDEYQARFDAMAADKIIPPGYQYNGRGGIEPATPVWIDDSLSNDDSSIEQFYERIASGDFNPYDKGLEAYMSKELDWDDANELWRLDNFEQYSGSFDTSTETELDELAERSDQLTKDMAAAMTEESK